MDISPLPIVHFPLSSDVDQWSSSGATRQSPSELGFALAASDVGGVPAVGFVAGEHEGLVACLQTEFAGLEHPLAVGADKGEVGGGEAEGDGLGLAGLQLNLVEGTQTAVVGGAGSDEVGGEEQHGLLACHTAGIGDIDLDGKHVRGAERGFIDGELVVAEGGVAEAVAEGPLLADDGFVVIGSLHDVGLLAGLVVVGGDALLVAGIADGHLGAEVGLAADEACEGVAAVVAGEEDVDDGLAEGFNLADDAGTAFVEHEDDGFACGSNGLHEGLLGGRDILFH